MESSQSQSGAFPAFRERQISTGCPSRSKALIGLTLKSDVPPPCSCTLAQPVLPIFHEPKLNQAEGESKNLRPSGSGSGTPCIFLSCKTVMSAALRIGATPVTQDANKWLRRRFRSSVRASFVINRDQISVTYSQRPILKETLRMRRAAVVIAHYSCLVVAGRLPLFDQVGPCHSHICRGTYVYV